MERSARRAIASGAAGVLLGALAACGGGSGGQEKAGGGGCAQRLADATERPGVGFIDLAGCDLSGKALNELDMSQWDLSRARLVDADLREADLSSADLSRADLTGANLAGATVAFTRMGGATLSRTDFAGAHMSGLDLSGATLTAVSFASAQLSRVSFAGTTLDQVVFTGTSMQGVDLTGATLRGGDLSHVGTEQVTLTDATLASVPLDSADLSGATGLTDAALAGALGVRASGLAQALADHGVVLESSEDIGRAVRAACAGTPIPDAVPGVTRPPRIARPDGPYDWAAVDDRSVPAARFIDVVACVGPVASKKVRTCGPYTGYQRYYGLFSESATIRLTDARLRASTSVALKTDPPPSCPTYMTDATYVGHLDVRGLESDWVPHADRLALTHPG